MWQKPTTNVAYSENDIEMYQDCLERMVAEKLTAPNPAY